MSQPRGLVTTVLLAAACGGPPGGGPPAEAPAVEIVAAREGALPETARVNGVVRAENQVLVRPEVEAVVEAVLVDSGDAVRKGQPLVRLRDDTLRDQLGQADAAVRLAEASLREAEARVRELRAQVSRTRQLADEQLVSGVELETQEAQLAAAEAAADSARARADQAKATTAERRTALDKTVIRSPVAGRVGQRQVEPGMLVGTSDVVFEVGNLDKLRVEVPLTGELLRSVKPGQPVVVRSEALDEPLRAELTRLSPFLARDSFSTTGEIELPAGGAGAGPAGALRPGLFVSVDLLLGEGERGTLVPASAVWEDPQDAGRWVFVVRLPPGATPPETVSAEAHAVEARRVEVRGEGSGTAAVSGVQPGEWVVTVGQHLLERGADARARVRRTSWDRMLELQGLQREDILRDFMAKQQRVARTLGAAPPTTEELRRAARETR